MHVVHVNVGTRTSYHAGDRDIATGIDKRPVDGPRRFGHLGVEGDTVVDTRVHGGTHKAAYLYPGEHYDAWRADMPELPLAPGYFGENLTTHGVDETTLHIGDRLRIGAAECIVSEPRFPCVTLGAKVGTQTFVKRFLDSGRSGIYLYVDVEGAIAAGDTIEILAREPEAVSVADFVQVQAHAKVAHHDARDIDILERLLRTAILGAPWRERFTQRLHDLRSAS